MFSRLALRPRVSPITDTRCACCCHAAPDGERLGAPINGLIWPGVARDDAIGAASACDRCRYGHCPALAGRPPELDVPARRWNPRPLTPVEPQGDGDDGC